MTIFFFAIFFRLTLKIRFKVFKIGLPLDKATARYRKPFCFFLVSMCSFTRTVVAEQKHGICLHFQGFLFKNQEKLAEKLDEHHRDG